MHNSPTQQRFGGGDVRAPNDHILSGHIFEQESILESENIGVGAIPNKLILLEVKREGNMLSQGALGRKSKKKFLRDRPMTITDEIRNFGCEIGGRDQRDVETIKEGNTTPSVIPKVDVFPHFQLSRKNFAGPTHTHF